MEATVRNGFWSPRRFGQLLLREMVSGYRGLLIAMAAVGGSMLVISVLTGLGMSLSGRPNPMIGGEFFFSFYQNLLFIGGFILTSLAFREMWHNGGGIFYLTVPGSLFEKFTTKLLVTALGYAIGCTLFFSAVAALCTGVTLLVFGVNLGFLNPLDVRVLHDLLLYVGVQSVFLLGSVWFRRLALLRTVLWAVIFALALGIIMAVLARIIMAPHFIHRASSLTFDLTQDQLHGVFAQGTTAAAGLEVFRVIAQVLQWVTPPVLWVAGYFRLREVEV